MSSSSTKTKKRQQGDEEILGNVRPSIHFCMIRHAESANNQVYRNAKFMFRAGTPDFDQEGCENYISKNRKADPELSTKGYAQADALADYLVPHLMNQASFPFRIIVSPMRRTLLTIKPTLERLQQQILARQTTTTTTTTTPKIQILVVAYYFETEGCHLRGVPEEGMKPSEIKELLKDCIIPTTNNDDDDDQIQFIGFPSDPNPGNSGHTDDLGWYANGTGPETRAEAEVRAAKYCLWLSEFFDQQLWSANQDDTLNLDQDVFDASIALDDEAHEDEHDKHASRIRRRRTYLAIGHGDFMSTVLKRMVTGFGHYVENDGIPHRSAFAHFNTGITELEYFGHGRYLIMSTNQTPHIHPSQYKELKSGGTLRDGWSFLMPTDEAILSDTEVSIFSDTDLEDQMHIREQKNALKALYLSSGKSDSLLPPTTSQDLQVEEDDQQDGNNNTVDGKDHSKSHIIVKRGLQVVGVGTAIYSEDTVHLSDVAIRPTANKDNSVAETLLQAVKTHARKLGRSSSLIVHPRSTDAKQLFEKMGFVENDDDDSSSDGNGNETKKQTMTSKL